MFCNESEPVTQTYFISSMFHMDRIFQINYIYIYMYINCWNPGNLSLEQLFSWYLVCKYQISADVYIFILSSSMTTGKNILKFLLLSTNTDP